MKGIFLLLTTLVVSSSLYAQWNNTANSPHLSYSPGNVRIGTDIPPRGKFDVDGPGDIYLVDDPQIGGTQSLYLPGHIFLAPHGASDVSFIQARRLNSSGNTILRFRTTNNGTITDAMSIHHNGHVGIGTSAIPSQKLEVSGNIIAGGPGGVFWQGFKSNATAGSWGFQQNDIMMVGIGGNLYNKGFSTNAMGIFNALPSKEDIFLFNQNSPNGDFLVLKSSGNVGIGTVNPDAKLTVAGNVKVQRAISEEGTYDLQHWSTGNLAFDLRLQTVWNNSGITHKFVQKFDGTDYPVLSFYQGGVGIGITNPGDIDAALAVKGTIHTKEVKVDLSGAMAVPDYVFSESYPLRTLEEVEKFIVAHKHLPEVPSAADMEKDGMYLKEMNLLLLKKVEELTLYILEQEKRIASLESKVK